MSQVKTLNQFGIISKSTCLRGAENSNFSIPPEMTNRVLQQGLHLEYTAVLPETSGNKSSHVSCSKGIALSALQEIGEKVGQNNFGPYETRIEQSPSVALWLPLAASRTSDYILGLAAAIPSRI